LTNVYPVNNKNNNGKNNNKVKTKPLELYELAGKKLSLTKFEMCKISFLKTDPNVDKISAPADHTGDFRKSETLKKNITDAISKE
jgi:hypothetical protein